VKVQRLNEEEDGFDRFEIVPETSTECDLMTALYERTVLPVAKQYLHGVYEVVIPKRPRP
jgi:hypothetical protein